MDLRHVFVILLIICLVDQCSGRKGKKKKKGRKGRVASDTEECVLFRDTTLYNAKDNGPSYIRLDKYDFTGDLEISFWVLPDRTYHNGPLFNVGSEDKFKYYEWKTKALHTQFMVIEITYEAVAMLTKVLWQKHMLQTELFTTHPQPYNIINGHWAYISATRKDDYWTLSLNDTVVKTEAVINQTDIDLIGRHAYLGGRPGYSSDNVFRGIVKDVHVNGQLVPLKGKKKAGSAEVLDCDSEEVKKFAKELVTFETDEYLGDDSWYYQNGYMYPYDDGTGGIGGFDGGNEKAGNGYNSFMGNDDDDDDDGGFFGNVYGG